MKKTIIVAAFAIMEALSQGYPKPNVPADYITQVLDYDYSNYKPTGYWSIEKMSSKLNKAYLATGKTDASGKPVDDFERTTDGNANTIVQWQQG